MDASDTAAAGPVLRTTRTTLRAVTVDDVPTLLAQRSSPAVARWWHRPEPGWPVADDEGVHWAVELHDATELGADGALVGYAQAYPGDDPDYAVAQIDLFLAGSVHRRGLGREVVGGIVRWLVEELGHHRVQIDPALDNEQAIACYRAVGFRPVGVLHRYERDTTGPGWHDGLLMEYVTEPRAR